MLECTYVVETGGFQSNDQQKLNYYPNIFTSTIAINVGHSRLRFCANYFVIDTRLFKFSTQFVAFCFLQNFVSDDFVDSIGAEQASPSAALDWSSFEKVNVGIGQAGRIKVAADWSIFGKSKDCNVQWPLSALESFAIRVRRFWLITYFKLILLAFI